jgi:Family of unknown function (DUF5906)
VDKAAQVSIDALNRIREQFNAERAAAGDDRGHPPLRKIPTNVSRDDFYAYMPMHMFIFVPSGELWPASSVNSRILPQVLVGDDGKPVLGDNGERKTISASAWLDRNRPVEQMTWAPCQPMIIRDRLILDGGLIEKAGVSCFNLYKPPIIKLGDPAQAGPWLDHAREVFGSDFDHIVQWLAHRVQRPHIKINHALVLGGHPGIGKDTLLEPVKRAVGPWNFAEVTPRHLLGRFNGFAKSVILRVNEARDLGDVDRYAFYDHMKAYTAAPPDVLRIDEKNLREYNVINCCGVIITTNYKADGIYLPPDDRRHFVAWSDRKKEEFQPKYWNDLWGWYEREGYGHVAAYLASLDLSAFDPKAPPKKTLAFWSIVDASRAPEDAELADVLEELGNPNAVTIPQIASKATGEFEAYLRDRKNRRAIPHRLEKCGYTPVRNDHADDGLWRIHGKRQAVYAKANLSERDRRAAVSEVSDVSGPRSPSIDSPSFTPFTNRGSGRARVEAESEPLTSLTSLTGKSPVAEKDPRKSAHRCDYCGRQFGDMKPWDWPPDHPTRIIRLHERCEAAWYDSNGRPEGVQ